MRKFILLSLLLLVGFVKAQELNCTVSVNYDKVGATNTQIFKSLERSLNEFVNNTAWTDQSYKSNEKINCSMFITINSYDGSTGFESSIQVQSSRTIFNSTYSSPLVNINDKDFNFTYVEFQNLSYNPNSFDSNLLSVIAFYCYYIIGTDAETFEPNGGEQYYQQAVNIVGLAAPLAIKGWLQTEKKQNRYYLINDLLSPTFKGYRDAMYAYHFEGLDTMVEDAKNSKAKIKAAIELLNEINVTRPNAYLTRTFFDAKSEEIVSIFSGGPVVPTADLVELLGKLSPTNSSKWSKIK